MNRRERRKAGYKGKLFPDDKGVVNILMANKGDQVVIEFGTTLRWFAMGVKEADEFITKLQSHVDQLKLGALSAEREH